MSKVIVNNVELELNLLDADVMEKFENTIDEIKTKIEDPTNYEGKSNADGMRFQCRCIEEFMDKLFGDGMANRLFPKNNDLGIRLEAFGKVTSMSADARQQTDAIKEKYATRQPAKNRAQRRFEQRQGGKKHHNHNSAARKNIQ